MRALLDRRKQNDEGFTLIELLLVIIILGILAAVVVFSVRGVSDRGKNAACKSSKTALATAAEAYYSKNSEYPAKLNDLQPDFVSDFGGKLAGDGLSISGGDQKNSWTITYALTNGQYSLTTTDC